MPTFRVKPFDDRDGVIWVDGHLVEWRAARIHILTHGLHYASCVYDSERCYGGTVFKLAEHTERLFSSAKALDLAVPFSKEAVRRATKETLNANGLIEGYIRPIIWRGSERISTSARDSSVHIAISCWPWPRYYDAHAQIKGLSLGFARWRRPPPACTPCQAKASSYYTTATLNKHQAEADGYDDAIVLDWRGQISEATSANIFFVQGDELHTPIPDCFLDGITRQTVIDLARGLGYAVVERPMFPNECRTFSEAFLTSTAAEICPVREIAEVTFRSSTVSRSIIEAYGKETRRPHIEATHMTYHEA
jgi:branched-chain amino acid aminotransferase